MRRAISNLSAEDMRQIEAHRAKDRPTPWAHLAAWYSVNEVGLRNLFEKPANDDAAAKPEPPAITKEERRAARDARFRLMWEQDIPRIEMMAALGISAATIDVDRRRLNLPRREPGRKSERTAA